ncbi:MAG: replicative DNA helicase, partial [Parcubacteria group bacterium]|nr:replicative DNA helicase [Parcubacteria group bacterium]
MEDTQHFKTKTRPKIAEAWDRMPPQNIETEQSVLGSLMIDKEAISKIADVLSPEDFYRGTHQAIYTTMIELFERREPIDLLSVSSRLRENNRLEEIGGVAYLTDLVNQVPTAAHVVYYAKVVRQKKVLRDLIDASQQIAQLGYQETEDIELLLDEAEKQIFQISQHSLQQSFQQVKSSLEEAFDRIERVHKGDGTLRGIPTSFTDLDNILGGLQKSDLVVLAARPRLGKTSLALDIARRVAVHENIPVGIFSLEMSKEQFVDRLIAAQAGVNLWKLRTGKLSMHGEMSDFARIRDALDTLSKAQIYIDDAASPTILQMRAMARRLQAEKGLGLLIVDYLQLVQPRNPNESTVQQVTEISRSLKALARELNIPVLALSQLSRAIEQRPRQEPKLSDLRESGSIEQDADVVLFIYREDLVKEHSSKPNIAEIVIAKHRNGPVGRIELYFNEEQASFANLE